MNNSYILFSFYLFCIAMLMSCRQRIVVLRALEFEVKGQIKKRRLKRTCKNQIEGEKTKVCLSK